MAGKFEFAPPPIFPSNYKSDGLIDFSNSTPCIFGLRLGPGDERLTPFWGGFSTPCGAVSTRGIPVFVPGSSEL